MNLKKHENVSYRTDENLDKVVNTKYYKRHEPIFLDGECSYYEVVTSKRVIVDKIPITTAFFILDFGFDIFSIFLMRLLQ